MLEFLVTILTLVGQAFIFKKMGREWWEGIIPIYSTYILFEILYDNGFKMLWLLVPFYNIYLIFKLNIDLAHEFDLSTGFGVGLTLLSGVFYPLLGLSKKYQYIGEGGVYVDPSEVLNTQTKSNVADELAKYKELLDNGAITVEEYEAKKRELLDLE